MGSFSSWTAWGGRNHIDGSELPGLYLLGRWESAPPETVDPLDPNVIYIGITETQTLRARWQQFAASAFHQTAGHSGGWTFSAKFCNLQPCEPPAWLHVAAMSFSTDQLGRIKPLKQQYLADFNGRHGSLPVCNTRRQ